MENHSESFEIVFDHLHEHVKLLGRVQVLVLLLLHDGTEVVLDGLEDVVGLVEDVLVAGVGWVEGDVLPRGWMDGWRST